MSTKSYIGRLPCNSRSLGARAISQCTWTLRAPHTSRARVCFLIYIYIISRHGMMTRKWDYIVVLICGVISWKCLPVPAEYHDCREFQRDGQFKQRLPNIETFAGVSIEQPPKLQELHHSEGDSKLVSKTFSTHTTHFSSLCQSHYQYSTVSHSFECRIFF